MGARVSARGGGWQVARFATGRQGGRGTIGRARLYVTYGATCAINSDVVVAARGEGGEQAARAQPASDLLTITFHVPST